MQYIFKDRNGSVLWSKQDLVTKGLASFHFNQRKWSMQPQGGYMLAYSRIEIQRNKCFSSRNESNMGRYESNHTLDSDCSSLISSRRPSVDTISTYLSLESCTVEDDHSQNIRYRNLADAG